MIINNNFEIELAFNLPLIDPKDSSLRFDASE